MKLEGSREYELQGWIPNYMQPISQSSAFKKRVPNLDNTEVNIFTFSLPGFRGPGPCLGCELWIHQTKPLVPTPQGLRLQQRDFRIATQTQVADPSRLFVQLEHDAITMQFVVLHAPCLGKNKGDGIRPIDILDHWWKETALLFHKRIRTEFVWVYIDANAPMNQDFSPFTDDAGAEALNPQGRLFGDFLQDTQMYVPSTFSNFHSGDHFTWTHSSGSRYRRDYVLVSRSILSLTVST